jgi:RNA polymerase sigma-70 factor (ECF subfamily)
MEQADDPLRALVKRSAEGDEEGSRELYERLVSKIFPFVRSRTRTKEEAVDLTQDVFIDFFTSLSHFSFSSTAQLYAYLFVIARRKLARQYTERIKKGIDTTVAYDDEVLVTSGATEDSLRSLEVATALEGLEEVTREIVVLHHWSRHTFAEIAQMLGMKETAVRVRHHRALAQLQKYFHTETP